MAIKIRVLRAAAAGNRPASLEPGQLFVDEFEGKMFVRNPSGGITETGKIPEGMATQAYVNTAVAALTFVGLAGFAATDIAKLSGAAFSVSPTVPTPAQGDDSTKVATTAYVDTVKADMLGTVPDTLNSMQEIVAALTEDDSAIAAVTATAATKCTKAANLGDVADVSAARLNLGLGDLATANLNDLVLDEGAI